MRLVIMFLVMLAFMVLSFCVAAAELIIEVPAATTIEVQADDTSVDGLNSACLARGFVNYLTSEANYIVNSAKPITDLQVDFDVSYLMPEIMLRVCHVSCSHYLSEFVAETDT